MSHKKNKLNRFAVDHCGSLGSLYDANRDSIRGKLPTDYTSKSTKLEDLPKCFLTNSSTPENPNLLEMIRIQCELRLSIFLKLVSTSDIASLIDYPLRIDQNTRFIYFRHDTLRESLCDISDVSLTSSSFGTSSTHIITEITYGIVVLMIIKLPPNHNTKHNSTLERICTSLSHDQCAQDIDEDEEGNDLFKQIDLIHVYSNIDELTKVNQFENIYSEIFRLKTDLSKHQQVMYTLNPISPFFPDLSPNECQYCPLHESIACALETYLIQWLSKWRKLTVRLNDDLSKTLPKELITELKPVQERFSEVKQSHEKRLKKLRNLVVKIRKNIAVEQSNNALLTLCSNAASDHSIQDLNMIIVQLESKSSFVQHLRNDGWEYCNVVELNIKQIYSKQFIEHLLRENYPEKTIICLSDDIRDKHSKNTGMIDARKNNPNMNFVYADFTYSTYELEEMLTIVPHDSQTSDKNPLNTLLSIPTTDNYINIIMLGDSGVGKSSFINAFANYLRFETLEQAQQTEPTVIIPVSFLMAINDNFEERIVEFGKQDPNENHNEIGQSVTEHCKSYVFNISDEKKLRIIDTPGFGDTRGIEQDNLNMDDIFSFLKYFPYINGICLLFKPEVIQLNPYLRSCCTQLFNYFGKNIRDHIIFCFTNARSTFFAPGNTRPLLNTFFQSFPVKNIPFTKNNTFCFDSESFRYLVALQNGIEFGKNDRKEFEQSWSRSVTESKRFRDYLLKQSPYRRNSEWKSIQDAQSQISYAIRPILESMRNDLRNIILYDSKSSIELCPIPLKRKQNICYTCKRTIINCEHFVILSDLFHNLTQQCDKSKQTFAQYTLQYQSHNILDNHSLLDLKKRTNYLCNICAEFTYFMMKTLQDNQEDLFLTGFERMVTEENANCEMEATTNINTELTKRLKELQILYEKRLEVVQLDADPIDLCHIYCLINSLNEIPTVKKQLDAIKQYHQYLLKSNERNIPTSKPT